MFAALLALAVCCASWLPAGIADYTDGECRFASAHTLPSAAPGKLPLIEKKLGQALRSKALPDDGTTGLLAIEPSSGSLLDVARLSVHCIEFPGSTVSGRAPPLS